MSRAQQIVLVDENGGEMVGELHQRGSNGITIVCYDADSASTMMKGLIKYLCEKSLSVFELNFSNVDDNIVLITLLRSFVISTEKTVKLPLLLGMVERSEFTGKGICTHIKAYPKGCLDFHRDEVFERCGANFGCNTDAFSLEAFPPGKLHWPSSRPLEKLDSLKVELGNSGRFACVVGKNILKHDCICDVKFYKDDFYFVTELGRVAKLEMNLPNFALNFERPLEGGCDPDSFRVASVISRDPRQEQLAYLTNYLVELTGELLFVKASGLWPDKEIMKVNTVTEALTNVANLGVDCHFVGHNIAVAYDATK